MGKCSEILAASATLKTKSEAKYREIMMMIMMIWVKCKSRFHLVPRVLFPSPSAREKGTTSREEKRPGNPFGLKISNNSSRHSSKIQGHIVKARKNQNGRTKMGEEYSRSHGEFFCVLLRLSLASTHLALDALDWAKKKNNLESVRTSK